MGELDITNYHIEPAFFSGVRYLFLTVFVTWLPLAIVGIVLGRKSHVQATMRGGMALRVLARLAITMQVGAMAFSLLMFAGFLTFETGDSWLEVFLFAAIGLCVILPIGAISAAGLVAWHRVLVALAIREGQGRMLV